MSNLAVQCIDADCPPFWTVPSGRGVDEKSSKIAKDIEKAIAQLRESVTITYGRFLVEMRSALKEIYRECSKAGWDGYGAHAITEGAYEEAIKIIDLLPSSFPAPEIVAEPTGDIGFEWHKGTEQIFALSVTGKNRIIYAGIFAGNKEHGSIYFEETLPLVIKQHLKRLYS